MTEGLDDNRGSRSSSAGGAGRGNQLASVGCRVAPRKPLVRVPRRGGTSRNDICGGAIDKAAAYGVRGIDIYL